jgi:predicted RNA-binding protein YlxR (DUF448 family)/ribosomal protein L7Ae-like RNA K-turn-binding protein
MQDSPMLETGTAAGRRTKVRTCVGCQGELVLGEHGDQAPHVRVVLGPALAEERAEVAVDFAGSSFGRGAHVHVQKDCLERAARGGFARAFKRPVHADAGALAAEIRLAADARIRGLLVGARRATLLAFGEEARDAIGNGRAQLAVVASDAGGSATKGPLLAALHDGKVIAWGDKTTLGALFGRPEVALVAVLDVGLARQIESARATADAARAGMPHE